MRPQTKARALFVGGAVLASAALALVVTYAYWGVFAHDRYYDGTLKRVNDKDAALVAGLLDSAAAQAAFPRDREAFSRIFQPLYGLMLFELHFDGQELFSNSHPERRPGAVLKRVSLGGSTPADPSDDHTLVIRKYQPPSWNKEFRRWLSAPGKWVNTSRDRITGSFVAFFSLCFISVVALGWRARAGHLERQVLPHLRKVNGE
jgi:hypothetical protein